MTGERDVTIEGERHETSCYGCGGEVRLHMMRRLINVAWAFRRRSSKGILTLFVRNRSCPRS